MISLSNANTQAMDSADAQGQIDAILNDKDHPYWKGDAQAVEHVNALYAAARPGPQVRVGARVTINESVPQPKKEPPASAPPTSWIPPEDALKRMDSLALQRLGEAERARRLALGTEQVSAAEGVSLVSTTAPPVKGTPDQGAAPPLDVSELPARADGRHWSAPLAQAFAEDARALGADDDEVRFCLALDAAPCGFTAAHGEQFLAGLGELRKDAERAEALAFSRLRLGVRSYLDVTGRRHDPRVKAALIQAGASLLADRETIDAILADTNHPSQNPAHPNYQDAQAELSELYARVYRTKQGA